MSRYVVILITAPGVTTAKNLGKKLVEEKLAACVNVVPGLTSYYWWEGEVQEDSEVLLIVKTLKTKVGDLIKRVKELHPYQVPEVIAIEIKEGLDDYLRWMDESLK